MKILHVTKKYPKALGGDSVVVANLHKQQRKAGHKVCIVTSNCDEITSSKHLYKFGLKDTPAQLDEITPKRLISLIALFFRMFTILRKERPDIIHSHSIDMTFIVSFAARWFRIPLIHTFHIVTFYDSSQSAFRRKTELWLAKHAKLRAATAPNMHDVQKLREAGLGLTSLLPNGVDMALWHTSRGKLDIETQFVAVGRLENQKGFRHLIKATALIANMPALKVFIVGEGSQRAALVELIEKMGVSNIVTLVGRKSPKEIRTMLARSSAAVFPSLYETTPLTLLEAWATGAPTISTPVGILRDAPPDFNATMIIPPKDEQALATAMTRCATDTKMRQAHASAGRKEAAQYSWLKIARTAETIYQNVL